MVLKHNTTIENIYDSLERLTEFFSSETAGKADNKTLSMIEHDLVSVESRLKLFANYKPSRK
jgi:hypothetical protein